MPLKFCPKCGGKLSPDGLFCTACGADLRERMENSEAPTPIEKAKSVTTTPIQTKTPSSPSSVTYAVFYQRALAWFIDFIILWILTSIITSQPVSQSIVLLIFGIIYFWFLESFNKGQTLGKIFLKLRTVDEKTLKPTTKGKYIINNFTKTSFLLPLDVLIGLLKNRHEPGNRIRFTQNASKTVVIKLTY